jgi:hypothetical protein
LMAKEAIKVARKSSVAGRRTRAVESFKTAADCIGKVEPGMSLFAVTRGQFSMIDAVLHVLHELGPSTLTLWTWAIAEYEIERFNALRDCGHVTDATLMIDGSARERNAMPIASWRGRFGQNSVRLVSNHAKIATVDNGQLKVLLRGSMNLNFNPRFEQLDVTEGGPDFDLVREIESELPFLPMDVAYNEITKASKTDIAFDAKTLDMFAGLKVWAK